MKILAIWERMQAHPRKGGIFCLCDNGNLLHITHLGEFLGTDSEGERKYSEIDLQITHAFHDTDRFDFNKAAYFMNAFGGKLVAKFLIKGKQLK